MAHRHTHARCSVADMIPRSTAPSMVQSTTARRPAILDSKNHGDLTLTLSRMCTSAAYPCVRDRIGMLHRVGTQKGEHWRAKEAGKGVTTRRPHRWAQPKPDLGKGTCFLIPTHFTPYQFTRAHKLTSKLRACFGRLKKGHNLPKLWSSNGCDCSEICVL